MGRTAIVDECGLRRRVISSRARASGWSVKHYLLDLSRAPYVVYGVKYIDLVSLSRLAGASLDTQHGISGSHLDLSRAPYV